MRLAMRVGGGARIGVLFFLIVVVLMPFAIGPDLALLGADRPGDPVARRAARQPADARPAVRRRPEDGSLDLILMGGTPLELAVAAKALAHWLTTGLPLVIATPLLGLFLNLDADASGAVALTLLAGTPALTFIGLIGAALSVALRRGGLLLAGAGPAADRAGADLRRRRLQCRDRRAGAVRHAVHDPVRADAGRAWWSARSPPRRRCGMDWSDATCAAPHCAPCSR